MLLLFFIRFAYSLAAGVAFWFGEPGASKRYVAEYNAQVLALPESETAWRIVRDAVLHPAPFIHGSKYPELAIEAAVPEDPLWPAVVKAVEANRAGLERAFVVSERKRMGMPLVSFDVHVAPEINWQSLDHIDLNASPLPLEVSLGHLGQIRKWARELAADCRVAAESGDSERVVRDLTAMLKLADKCNDPAMLISQLVGFAVRSLAAREIGMLLASYPGLLSDGELGSISKQLENAIAQMAMVNVEWEWNILFDWVEKVYSEDPSGDGFATYSGLCAIGGGETPSPMSRVLGLLASSVGAIDPNQLIGSRKEVLARIAAAREALKADMRTEPWARQKWLLEEVVRDAGNIQSLDDFPLALVVRGMRDFVESWASARHQLQIAALIVRIERYRIERAEYPASLDALAQVVPGTTPFDLFDGNPVRYEFRGNELPLLYSIGVDGVDDAGHPAADNARAGFLSMKRDWAKKSDVERQRLRGDTVLWPPLTVRWIDEGEKPFVPRRPVVPTRVRTP